MTKQLVMTFNTEDNKTFRVTIKNPKDSLERSTINQVAEKIVSTRIFNNSKRVVKSLKKVAYVTRDENVVE
ncbi:DUF2922 domain-containing protein [Gemelliphila palaticanis]|uniref:DUF2922 domain-containing protein n=1 Tax=Gemelliphila palaticanis TaxID=81950 RepID=A0ABX2T4S2_9BACL|nr:DUF2922 domain-containing protein [Gemella palaticanis]MBF0716066.1 DUF2922 domain-containing protein [Gemella palaticanis]NYS47996.1 DUF2922 domain-containing protein [Gemella palaticanis]